MDRIDAYLDSCKFRGNGIGTSPPNIVGTLFLNYGRYIQNVDFNRNLYFAKIVIYMILIMPILILICWGVTCIIVVNPPVIGAAILCFGLCAVCLYYGIGTWKRRGWRMQRSTLWCFFLSAICLFAFMLIALYIDKRPTSFFASSCIWLTMNCIPMIWIVFINDPKLERARTHLDKLYDKQDIIMGDVNEDELLTMAITGEAKQILDAPKTLHKYDLLEEQALLSDFIDDIYTIDPSQEVFKYSNALSGDYGRSKTMIRSETIMLYAFAIVFLGLYSIITPFTNEDYGGQGIGATVSIIVLDICLWSCINAEVSWGPSGTAFIIGLSRLWFCIWCGDNWLLGHMFAYLTFAFSICFEFIINCLPRKSILDSTSVDIIHESEKGKKKNLFGTNLFSIGLISFYFLIVLLVDIFIVDDDGPAEIHAFGVYWNLYDYAVLALMCGILFSLVFSTYRAFRLESDKNLKNDHYFVFKPVRLPWVLAIITEILFILGGFINYGMTDNPFVLIIFIFLPLIITISICVFMLYQKNDYCWTEDPEKRTEKKEKEEEIDIEQQYYNSEEYYNLYYYGTTDVDLMQEVAPGETLPGPSGSFTIPQSMNPLGPPVVSNQLPPSNITGMGMGNPLGGRSGSFVAGGGNSFIRSRGAPPSARKNQGSSMQMGGGGGLGAPPRQGSFLGGMPNQGSILGMNSGVGGGSFIGGAIPQGTGSVVIPKSTGSFSARRTGSFIVPTGGGGGMAAPIGVRSGSFVIPANAIPQANLKPKSGVNVPSGSLIGAGENSVVIAKPAFAGSRPGKGVTGAPLPVRTSSFIASGVPKSRGSSYFVADPTTGGSFIMTPAANAAGISQVAAAVGTKTGSFVAPTFNAGGSMVSGSFVGGSFVGGAIGGPGTAPRLPSVGGPVGGPGRSIGSARGGSFVMATPSTIGAGRVGSFIQPAGTAAPIGATSSFRVRNGATAASGFAKPSNILKHQPATSTGPPPQSQPQSSKPRKTPTGFEAPPIPGSQITAGATVPQQTKEDKPTEVKEGKPYAKSLVDKNGNIMYDEREQFGVEGYTAKQIAKEERKRQKEEEKARKKSQKEIDMEEGKKEDKSKPHEEEQHIVIDPATLSSWEAFWAGCLTFQDYMVIALLIIDILLILLMGMFLTIFIKPHWIGMLISLILLTLITTIEPIVRYFHKYEMSIYVQNMIILTVFLFLITEVYSGWAILDWDMSNDNFVLILMMLFVYPAFILLCSSIIKWWDDEWKLCKKTLTYMWVNLVVLILCHIPLYFWANYLVAISFLIILIVLILAYYMIRQWVIHDYYIAPKMIHKLMRGSVTIIVILLLVSLIFSVSLVYFLSVSLIIIAAFFVIDFCICVSNRNDDSPLYFSPYLFPIYSYDAKTNTIKDENRCGIDMISVMILAIAWGFILIAFVHPIGIGVCFMCVFLLVGEWILAYCLGTIPIRLGNAAAYCELREIKQAIDKTIKDYRKRRERIPIYLEDEKDEYIREEELTPELINAGLKTAYDRRKYQCAFDAAKQVRDYMIDLYIKVNVVHEKHIDDHGEEIEEEREEIIRKSNGLWRFKDMMDYTLKGRGPYGFISPLGIWPCIRHCCSKNKYDKITNEFELNIRETLRDLLIADECLAVEYSEEYRALIEFTLLLLVSANGRMKRDGLLFTKFMKENKFRLMANDIVPPKEVFREGSSATLDTTIIATWLSQLTPEQKEKFFALKDQFDREEILKEKISDDEDKCMDDAAVELEKYWKSRDTYMLKIHNKMLEDRRKERLKRNIKIPKGKDELTYNADCTLSEIKRGRCCKPDAETDEIQFQDPDFPHNNDSIGVLCTTAENVVGWEVATSINPSVELYGHSGTDPSDIFQGVISDGWLLSSLSILSAATTLNKNQNKRINPLIRNIIYNKHTSKTGAYLIKLYKNAVWHQLLIDDYFPILDKIYHANKCAGAAMAYCSDFDKLWVPLIEKAFAKYYGAYASLEVGYVHQALYMLTGYPAEEIHLARAARGNNRSLLWSNLLKFKHNGFLLGAGTVTQAAADKEVLDSGLVWGSAYGILDVRSVDGHKLIKLRNPPDYCNGDMIWKGDWGRASNLWTTRMRHKLQYDPYDIDDTTFWMSFNDFCQVFRSLFVCCYISEDIWKKKVLDGRWSKLDGTAVGLPGRHNLLCDLRKVPTYLLKIDRDTDVIIKIQQCDRTGHIVDKPLPISAYIVKDSKYKDEEFRVDELNYMNVVSSTGNPDFKHEIEIRASLSPRCYALLICTYNLDDEGLFNITVYSNYNIVFAPMSTVEELEIKRTLAHKFGFTLEEHMKRIENKVKYDHDKTLNKYVENVVELPNEQDGLPNGVIITKNKWKEMYDDNKKRTYYYDTTTGKSQWEKPADYIPEKKLTKCTFCHRIAAEGVKKNPTLLIPCSNHCGVMIHPTCAGFLETEAIPEKWTCEICSSYEK